VGKFTVFFTENVMQYYAHAQTVSIRPLFREGSGLGTRLCTNMEREGLGHLVMWVTSGRQRADTLGEVPDCNNSCFVLPIPDILKDKWH